MLPPSGLERLGNGFLLPLVGAAGGLFAAAAAGLAFDELAAEEAPEKGIEPDAFVACVLTALLVWPPFAFLALESSFT
jgi:hypothetical protein